MKDLKLDITGRNVDITEALRQHTAEKLGKLQKLVDDPLEAHVVLRIDKHRQLAEIQIKTRSIALSGAEETEDLYASIGEVVDKLERQLLKHKEKVRDHKHRRGPRDPEIAAAIEASAAPESEVPESRTRPVKPRIVLSRQYRVKPMSAEEAVLELEATSQDLLVFRESETSRINVVYRQQDGSFALVDPQL